MSSQLRKVARGETLRVPADTWNTLIDVARSHRQRELSQGVNAGGLRTSTGIVTVRNTSGADQDRFAVMGLSGIVIPPADNELEFQSRPAFDVVVPTEDHSDSFVILTEPVAAGRLARAMVAGVTPVKLDVQSEDDQYAVAKAGETAHLETGSGSARILWKESGTGLKWGVVLFPVGQAQLTAFAVFDGNRTNTRYTGHIKNDGGSLGDAVQFMFLNDPGVADLLDPNDVVEIKPCPTWKESDSDWGDEATYGKKYLATLSPWAAMG